MTTKRPKRSATVGSASRKSVVEGDPDLFDSFWDIGNFKPVLKRISNGAKLCDELCKMMSERAAIEKQYAKALQGWAEKWEDKVPKIHEFGSLKQGWESCCEDARAIAWVHDNVKDKLVDSLKPRVEAWKKENFQKSVIHYKAYKRANSAFEKAQHPWSKRKAKIIKYRAAISKSIEHIRLADQQKQLEDGETKKLDAAISKARKEKLKAEQKLKQHVFEMRRYADIYRREMQLEFNRCQAEERKRIEFFKQILLDYSDVTAIGGKHQELHCQLPGKLHEVNPDYDITEFDRQFGSAMPMVLPNDDGTFALQSGEALSQLSKRSSAPEFGASISSSSSHHLLSPPSTNPPTDSEDNWSDVEDAYSPMPERRDITVGMRVHALYDYDSTRQDELSFHANDEIQVLPTGDDTEDGWFRGKLVSTGQEGIVPGNYVEA